MPRKKIDLKNKFCPFPVKKHQRACQPSSCLKCQPKEFNMYEFLHVSILLDEFYRIILQHKSTKNYTHTQVNMMKSLFGKIHQSNKPFEQ